MRRAALTLLMVLPALAACASTGGRKPVSMVSTAPQPAWVGVATAVDTVRLARLPSQFAAARASVPKSRATKVAAEAALVDPTAAQALPELPPGPYHCRLVRFGGKARFATYAPDICYVEAGTDNTSKGAVAFTKQTGSNLPEGWIYPDGDKRQVFLGASRRKGEPGGRRYGDNPAYDLAGLVERVSPFRWRLILTRAEGGGALDMYELVPATPQVPGAKLVVPAS